MIKGRKQLGAVPLRLFDPGRGDLPFKWMLLDERALREPARVNYFTVVWVREGRGLFHSDLARYPFRGPTLLFFNPYQTHFLVPQAPLEGAVLQFHANFFCIETHHEEVGCNGVLFNDHYGEPQVRMEGASAAEIEACMLQIEREFQTAGLAHAELLVSLLKILLIKAARLKMDQFASLSTAPASEKPPVLLRLTELIEQHYKTLHRPSDYGELLSMTPKALGKLVKKALWQNTHRGDPGASAQAREVAASSHAPPDQGDRRGGRIRGRALLQPLVQGVHRLLALVLPPV